MEFISSAIDVLKLAVSAIGGAVGALGIINLLEGYGGDNPAAKSQGGKQLMAGGGIVLVAQMVIPQLASLFS